jgi:hypothetical protein
VVIHEIIRTTLWESGRPRIESYEVLPDFTLRNHKYDDAFSCALERQSEQSQNSDTGSLAIQERDLEMLFAQEEPEWLRLVLESQLRHWKLHNVEHFYHYTPWKMNYDDILRCAKAAPTQALRRFSSLLTAGQKRMCCEKAPRAAAAYAFESLDQISRRNAIENYPMEVLRNSSVYLSEKELIYLATKSPASIFRCCRCMPGQQKALVLSVALRSGRDYSSGKPSPGMDMLSDSLADFPSEWLIGGGSFEAIISAWEDRLGWMPNGDKLMEMFHRIDSTYQLDFAKAVAKRI